MDQDSLDQDNYYLNNLLPLLGSLDFRKWEVWKFDFGKSGFPNPGSLKWAQKGEFPVHRSWWIFWRKSLPDGLAPALRARSGQNHLFRYPAQPAAERPYCVRTWGQSESRRACSRCRRGPTRHTSRAWQITPCGRASDRKAALRRWRAFWTFCCAPTIWESGSSWTVRILHHKSRRNWLAFAWKSPRYADFWQ